MHARPALGRVPDAEVRGGTGVEAAFAEEPPGGDGLARRELRAEELGGGGVGGVQARAPARVGGRAAVLVVQREADAPGEALDGLGERQVVHLAQERVDVARLAAAEAVVEAGLRSHVEARAALVVERAQPLHGPDARRLERHALADDVGDVGARLDLVDVGLADPPGHQRPSTGA